MLRAGLLGLLGGLLLLARGQFAPQVRQIQVVRSSGCSEAQLELGWLRDALSRCHSLRHSEPLLRPVQPGTAAAASQRTSRHPGDSKVTGVLGVLVYPRLLHPQRSDLSLNPGQAGRKTPEDPVEDQLKLTELFFSTANSLANRKCLYQCAFTELGLVDDEGLSSTHELQRVLELAAGSTELRTRASEVAQLCSLKMVHVEASAAEIHSARDGTCSDYPLLVTRCVLGRLAKHCEELARLDALRSMDSKQPPVHPDVELLH